MPTSYTSLLGLALPVTGELSGTWGDTVNDYITQYLDAAVAGAQTISGSQTAVTLSKTTASSLTQAGSGSTGSSQYQIINCTGNPAGLLTITVPAASKAYLVLNSTSTSQSVKVVGAGPTTGVTMVSGEKALIAWDGSDFVKVASSTADGVTTLSFGTTGLTPNSATAGAITVAGTLVAANGGTGQSSYTTGDLLYATGSTALSKLGIGTNGQVLTSTGTAPQWSTLSGVAVTTFSAGTTGFTPSTATSGAITLAGTLATTNGGTGLTSFTANGVVYASSTSALTTGSALTFDGTNISTALGGSYYSANANYGFGTPDSAGLQIFTASGDSIRFGSRSAGTFSEQMRLTSTGLGIGTSSPGFKLDISGGGTTAKINTLDTNDGGASLSTWMKVGRRAGTGTNAYINTLHSGSDAVSALTFAFGTTGTGTEVLRLTSTGFTQPVAYADTVSALGNTGTAKTIDLTTANVFTATLTGNCTFTLSNPIATGSSSFTLILTNDGTAGRTVAWAGGSFVFPGGAASLSRTTTANAVDVWVFFTPNGGTTWYGNIAMKDMKA